MSWDDWALAELDELRRANRLRTLTMVDGSGIHAVVGGRKVVSFATNDYLGLSTHPLVRAAAHSAIDQFGASSTSSRLIMGTRCVHAELETAIAAWKHCERALVFPTGFAANLGVLATLGTANTTIFSDALNHASIIDGCRLSKATTLVYRHADCEHLASLLASTSGRKIVVTDAVFSMDGDVAPLEELARLCAEHGALLVLDEAHAVLDLEPPPHDGLELLRVGTLSKMLGSLGGWVAGPRSLIQLLINRARSFIYTTGLSPPNTAAALAALQVFRGSEGQRLRTRLRELIERIQPGHRSPIIPVILGTESAALAAAETLLAADVYVPAIRPPTVPAGTARLRIALSAAHTDAMVAQLAHVLTKVCSGSRSVCAPPA
jgi:8-amino-7-oxononanoate synthase